MVMAVQWGATSATAASSRAGGVLVWSP
jgi:hypothetical protein